MEKEKCTKAKTHFPIHTILLRALPVEVRIKPEPQEFSAATGQQNQVNPLLPLRQQRGRVVKRAFWSEMCLLDFFSKNFDRSEDLFCRI